MEYKIPAELLGQLYTNDSTMETEELHGVLIEAVRSCQPVEHKKSLPDPINYLKEVMEEKGLCNKDLKIYIVDPEKAFNMLK